jgi:hypothetical protein
MPSRLPFRHQRPPPPLQSIRHRARGQPARPKERTLVNIARPYAWANIFIATHDLPADQQSEVDRILGRDTQKKIEDKDVIEAASAWRAEAKRLEQSSANEMDWLVAISDMVKQLLRKHSQRLAHYLGQGLCE